MMIEALTATGIALITGLAAVTNRLHTRINDLDSRVDRFELRIATDYLSKAEFTVALERVEAHMIRIEDKLDKLVT